MLSVGKGDAFNLHGNGIHFWVLVVLDCKELYYYYILGDKKLHWPLGEVVFGEGGPKDQTMGIWCFNIKFQIHAKIF